MTQDQHPDTGALGEAARILRAVATGAGETRAGAVESWCLLACVRLERAGAVANIEQPPTAIATSRSRIIEALAWLSTLTEDSLDSRLIHEAIAATQRALAATRTRS